MANRVNKINHPKIYSPTNPDLRCHIVKIIRWIAPKNGWWIAPIHTGKANVYFDYYRAGVFNQSLESALSAHCLIFVQQQR